MHYNAQLNNELKTTSSFTIVKIIKHIGTNLTKRVQDIKIVENMILASKLPT